MKTLLCVLVVLALAAPVLAQTDITGNVDTDTTWDLAGSPYILHGYISVTSASTLTIDPGVTVKFVGNKQLKTYSGCSIVADGAYGNEILFTSNSDTPVPGDWYAVQLLQSPASSFSYCVFEYGQFNLYVERSDPTVSYCTSRYSEEAGILCDNASPQIESCDIIQNVRGIATFGPISAPVVHNCNLYGNSSNNMYVVNYEVEPLVTIDAENNWWGTDVDAEIASSIFIAGASVYVEVNYDPWLHEIPVEASSWGRVKAMFAE